MNIKLIYALFATTIAGLALSPGVSFAQQSISSTIVEDTAAADPDDAVGILRAVDDLLNVREYDQANEFLQKFIQRKPKTGELAMAHRKMGSSFFARIIRTAPVAELGGQVADLVLDAVTVANRDPKEINHLIDAAISENDNGRRSARSRLRSIGADAVPFILTRFTEGKLKEGQPRRLQHALATIGNAGAPAFIGALTSNNPAMIVEATSALQHFDSETALPWLMRLYFLTGSPHFDAESNRQIQRNASVAIKRNLGSLPDRDAAAKMLRSRVERLINDPLALSGNLDDNANVWLWNSANDELERQTLKRTEAAWLTATMLADDLYRISPDSAAHRELYLTTQLGWAKLFGGIGMPLADTAIDALIARSSIDPTEANLVLTKALAANQIPAAIAAAELLGHVDKFSVGSRTFGTSSNARALIQAIQHPHARVRLAALQAIMRLDPQRPFDGACDVAKSLNRMATATGSRHVLIIHPQRKQSTLMAGFLQPLGFTATVVGNGKAGLEASRKHADLELILISDAVIGPAAGEVLQQLDFDPLTGKIPVCLMTTGERIGTAAFRVQRFPQMESFPLPSTREGMASLLRNTLPLTDEFAMSPNERLASAQWALGQMAKLTGDLVRYSYYEPVAWTDSLIAALQNPELSAGAADGLGKLGTPAAQLALVNHAGQNHHSLTSRAAAADAFEVAVNRTGLLLESREIMRLYDNYNDNLDDQESAAILSSVIDSLELPSQRERRER